MPSQIKPAVVHSSLWPAAATRGRCKPPTALRKEASLISRHAVLAFPVDSGLANANVHCARLRSVTLDRTSPTTSIAGSTDHCTAQNNTD
jgi:hypothetical protein